MTDYAPVLDITQSPYFCDKTYTTDCSTGLQAAIDDAATSGKSLFVPAGQYKINSDITIGTNVGAPVVMKGEGSSGWANTDAKSRLRFATNKGLIVDVPGANTRIDGLGFENQTVNAGTSDLVTVYGRVFMKDCTVYGAGRDGVRVPYSNDHDATQCEFSDCKFVGANGNGLTLKVGNAVVKGGLAKDNGGYGVYIACSFGCAVLGLKFLGNNGSGAFWSTGEDADGSDQPEGQGQHTWIGCSISGGNGKSRLSGPSVFIGGNSTALFTPDSRGLRINGNGAGGNSPMQFQTPAALPAAPCELDCGLGTPGAGMIAYQWRAQFRHSAVTRVKNTNGVDIEVTTSDPHEMTTGDLATLSGVTTHSQALAVNNEHVATVTSSTTFTIPVTGTGGPEYNPGAAPYADVKTPEDDQTWHIQYHDDEKQFYLGREGSGGKGGMNLTTRKHPEGPGIIHFPFGFMIGNATYRRLFLQRSVEPTTNDSPRADGSWAVGDRVLALSPAIGQPYEWICITASTGLVPQGVWQALTL